MTINLNEIVRHEFGFCTQVIFDHTGGFDQHSSKLARLLLCYVTASLFSSESSLLQAFSIHFFLR
jgi:hypothetical protein